MVMKKFFFIAVLHERGTRDRPKLLQLFQARDFIVRKRKLIKLEAYFIISPSLPLIFYIFIASAFSSLLRLLCVLEVVL